MIFKNAKTYDVLKWIASTFLPALIVLYGVVGSTLSIPFTEQVLTIATAFDAFLGTILGISSKKYNEMEFGEDK